MYKYMTAMLLGAALMMCGCSDNEQADQTLQGVLDILPDKCELSSEEWLFYMDLYKAEYGKADKESVKEEELVSFISKYYAEFYLAKYYGISDSFSYEELKDMWMKENTSRQEKKQNGEIFYGPVEYELTDYFGYLYSNLKLKNIEMIVSKAGEDLVDAGRAYYEENSQVYDDLIGATCRLSDGERTEEKIFSYDDIQSLYKTNEAVLNFIMDSEIGDTMQYQNGDKTVTVELLAKEIDRRRFEDMQDVIMNDYVQREFYDELIDELSDSIEFSY